MHDISGTLYQTFVQIDPHSSEISLLIWKSFCYFSIIVTLKLYNFYTVQDRGIQSAYEMLCVKRAFQSCIGPINGLITLKQFKIEAHCHIMKCCALQGLSKNVSHGVVAL